VIQSDFCATAELSVVVNYAVVIRIISQRPLWSRMLDLNQLPSVKLFVCHNISVCSGSAVHQYKV